MTWWQQNTGKWLVGGFLALGLGSSTGCSDGGAISLGENMQQPATGGTSAGTGGTSLGGTGGGNGGSPTLGGAGSVSCPLIGCGPEFQMKFPLANTFGDTADLMISVCRKLECLVGHLVIHPAELTPGAGLGVEAPMGERNGEPLMSAFINGTEDPETLELEIWWRLWNPADAQDGDDYTVLVAERLVEPEIQTVFHEYMVVNYRTEQVAACTACLVAEAVPEP